MNNLHQLESFIRSIESYIDAQIEAKFQARLDAFKIETIAAICSNDSIPDSAVTYIQAIVEGQIPTTVAERAKWCAYVLDKIHVENNSNEIAAVIDRVKQTLLAAPTLKHKSSDENYLDDETSEFLTLKAANIYSLELVSLAYTHRDFSQLIESGYEELPKAPTINPITGEYDETTLAKLTYVAALQANKIPYSQLDTTKNWLEHAELEINDAGEIRPRASSQLSE